MRGLGAHDGIASVVVAGAVITEFPVASGSARYDLEATTADAVPAVTAGQPVEILFNGTPALRGTLKED